jgi:hypothetical protein
MFVEAESSLVELSDAYREVENQTPPSNADLARFVPFV